MLKMNSIVVRCFLQIIRIYQYCISPVFPSHCRYYPTCSSFVYQAIDELGVIKGLQLGVKRILRCNPLSSTCGMDPVEKHINRRNLLDPIE